MTTPSVLHHEHEKEVYSRTVFGFWVYLMTDCVLFGILFATYMVLHTHTFGGPTAAQLFDLPFALAETLILLVSSLACGIAMLPSHRERKGWFTAWMGLTFLLGASFLVMEITEFHHFVVSGAGWQRSAFLSSFFTLVATHGAHIAVGLLWMVVLAVQVARRGMTLSVLRRLDCFRLFWHFLDVVWIFIFSIVYLLGVG